MRAPRTVSLYLTREVLLHTAVGFLTAFPVVLVPNFAQRLEEFRVPGLRALDVIGVLAWAAPLVAAYALPIAFLFGSLTALGRLSGDGEITALRAGGLGGGALVFALIASGACVSAASAGLVLGLEARAQRELTRKSLELAARGGLIESGRFHRIGERVIFARSRGERHLQGVLISDWSREDRPFFVFAEAGELRFDRERGTMHLLLENGDIRLEPGLGRDFEEYRLSFARLDYAFQAAALSGESWRYWPNELSVGELRAVIARAEAGDPLEDLVYPEARVYRAQLHRDYAVPVAPLLFALVGAALGLRERIRGRARGLWLATGVLVAYYALFVFGQSAAYEGRLPPALGIWAPNALLAAGGLALLLRPRR
jgi:lipopolysaccharide export system permease protein